MTFIIAACFFPSLASLDKNENARVIDFMGEFLANPASPGPSLERATDIRSDDVWSARVSKDLRAIAHKDGAPWALPDVSSRFYVPNDQAELLAALNAPLKKWITFPHTSQRAIVATTRARYELVVTWAEERSGLLGAAAFSG